MAQSGHAVITTPPGSAVQSNGSTVCMIGGSGNRLAKIPRTKSSPDIDAIKSMGTMPYSMAYLPDLSSMISTHRVFILDLIYAFMIVQRGLPGSRSPAISGDTFNLLRLALSEI